MTHQQKTFVRYWLIGLSVLAAPFWLGGHEYFRLLLLPALIVAAILDKIIRPPKLVGTPTPLQVIENSRFWKAFIVLYAIAAVFMAVLAVVVHDLGSWLSQNSWLVFPALAPIVVGPIIQSEVAVYRACGENQPEHDIREERAKQGE